VRLTREETEPITSNVYESTTSASGYIFQVLHHKKMMREEYILVLDTLSTAFEPSKLQVI
jgi:hypothetical protein